MPDELEEAERADQAEVPAMTETARKIGAQPLPILALVLALAGGGGAGFSLLQGGGDEALAECRSMVTQVEARLVKGQADALSARDARDAASYASREDVARMSAKLDMVLSSLDEIREDLRESRRPSGRQR